MKRGVAAALLTLLLTGVAQADDAISPANGELIGSRPVIVYDFVNGVGEIEFSRSPDVKTSGTDIGAFVEYGRSDYSLLYTRSPLDGLAPFQSRLDSGLWYWHVRTRNDTTEVQSGWGPVRTVIVRDEPIEIEGWTARKSRLRQAGTCKRLRLRGTIAYNDNDPTPKVRVQVVVRNMAGRVIARIAGSAFFSSGAYDKIICTAATKVRLTPYLRDRAGHLTAGSARTV